ncbi:MULTISPECIES: hypothetical protein [unclassified Bradyrhizobium]|uniref:hypothetical protein n=1 Tax=Bradyrhizobium sp. USDA 4541 TaxID=2817704 RepID=UPI0020A45B7A|nr:hypothetical protein [Bradyrhizobium sp. USDA 4541]MCP1854233.1 hypothetical protein [Bradyrhizobium sp. USDA 4541]
MTPEEQFQLKIRAAERQHDSETKFGDAADASAVKSGEEAIKAVSLVNGGAAVAMLTFIGVLVSAGYKPEQVAEVSKPLTYFAAGVAAAIVGGALTYLVNIFISMSSKNRRREWEVPFVRSTRASRWYASAAEFFRMIAIVSVLASIGCFIAGVVSAKTAFTSLAALPKPESQAKH